MGECAHIRSTEHTALDSKMAERGERVVVVVTVVVVVVGGGGGSGCRMVTLATVERGSGDK